MSQTAEPFVRLWTRFQPEVRRYVRMMVPRPDDAEDVLQEAAARLWEKIDDYDPERPFVPWAIQFVKLEVLKWRQRQTRDRLIFSDEVLSQIDATICKEALMLEARRLALQGCLKKLTDSQRRLLLNRYTEHGSVQQEAQRSNVRVHKLYYSIEKLRAGLLACIDKSLAKEGL